jgi:hypothetical protein
MLTNGTAMASAIAAIANAMRPIRTANTFCGATGAVRMRSRSARA